MSWRCTKVLRDGREVWTDGVVELRAHPWGEWSAWDCSTGVCKKYSTGTRNLQEAIARAHWTSEQWKEFENHG